MVSIIVISFYVSNSGVTLDFVSEFLTLLLGKFAF